MPAEPRQSSPAPRPRHRIWSTIKRIWRPSSALLLLASPLLVLLVAGVVAFWQSGRWLWLWWFPVCWGLAYLLLRLPSRQAVAVPTPDVEVPQYWNSQDEEAWLLVAQQHQNLSTLTTRQLSDPQFYLRSTLDLAGRIARHYHPKCQDPVGSSTVSEIMAAAQLAMEDSAAWVHDHVPGSHLLTVDHWRMLSKAPKWARAVSNASWGVSILINPWNVTRYLASRVTMQAASKQIQENVLAWFYAAFIRHAGFYLIEMNSGRLRGGAARYRELQTRLKEQPLIAPPFAPDRDVPDESGPPCDVSIVVLGQFGVGKTSLVHALVRGQPDAVESTDRGFVRYRLDEPDTPDKLVLVDTPGYGRTGMNSRELEALSTVAEQADLILLPANVTQPPDQGDVELLDKIRSRITTRKLPPLVVALTHVDHLNPEHEWSPPYNWRQPSQPYEQRIADAIASHQQLWGESAAAIVPVSLLETSVYGVQEELLPAILTLLDEARACSLVRTLHRDLDSGQTSRLLQQFYNASRRLLRRSG